MEIYAESADEMERFEADKLLIIDDDGLRLTEEGIDISNTIMACFV